MKRIKRTLDHFNILGKTFHLIWRASKKSIIIITITNILLGLFTPISILFHKNFVNSLFSAMGDGAISIPIMWILFLWFINILVSIVGKVSVYHQQMQADYVNVYISELVLTKVGHLEMSAFDNADIYDQMAKINNQAPVRSLSILDKIVSLMRAVITLLGTVGILFIYNYILFALIGLILIPIIIVNINISRKMHKIYQSRIEKLRLSDALQNLMLQYNNIKEIKTFNLSEYLKNKITGIYKEYIEEDKRIRIENMKILSMAEIIELIAVVVFKILVVVRSIANRSSIGIVTMQINALDIVVSNTKIISSSSTNMYADNLYIQSLYDFLDLTSSADIVSGELAFPDVFNEIKFENVSFRYPNSTDYVLKNINLTIKSAHSYLLVGLNGAGKTTLVKLLLRLYAPTSGRITIDGVDIQSIDISDYNKQFATVFQDFIHYPLSIADNIKYGNIEDYSNADKMKEVASASGADIFINKLEEQYYTILQHEWSDGTEISGGEWQKLAISRALFACSSILIMDEPTAALDPLAEDEVFRHIASMIKKKTSLIISHRFTTVKLVDQIIIIENNTIAESGSFEELMAVNGTFANLYNIQAEKYTVSANGEPPSL